MLFVSIMFMAIFFSSKFLLLFYNDKQSTGNVQVKNMVFNGYGSLHIYIYIIYILRLCPQ